MQTRLVGLITIFIAIWPDAANGQKNTPILAVFQVEDQTKKLSSDAIQQFTSYLSARFAAGGSFRVIPSDQLKERLIQQKRESFKACYDQKCQIEVGRELAADKSVSTQVVQLGSKCAILSTLYDLKQATTERSASEKSDCSQDDLVGALEKVVEALKGQGMAASPPLPAPGKVPASVRTGGLFVKSKPTGASVRLDGTQMTGTTPVTLSNLPEGVHFIELHQGDYRLAGKVHVAADRFTNLTLELKKVKGKLEVLSSPPEAQIFLDGMAVGTTPKVLEEVEAGEHVVELKKSGYMTMRGTVRLGANKVRQTVNLNLIQAGILAVRSEPFGATVFVDRKRMGETPSEIKVAPGKHSVKLELQDRKPALQELNVQPGQVAIVSMKLVLSDGAQARLEAAAAAKRRELQAAPARMKAEAELRDREAAAEARRREEEAAKAPRDTPHNSSTAQRRNKTIWAYTSLGTSLVCLAAGGAFYGLGFSQRSSAYDSYRAANALEKQEEMDHHYSDVESSQTKITVGHVFMGIGIAALGFSIYEFVTRSSAIRLSEGGEQISLGLSPGAGNATVVFSGSY